jgi:hypothetical protein
MDIDEHLDGWLPDPVVRTFHQRTAATDPAALWAAAESVRIGECGLLGRLIRWRVPGTRKDQTYTEMFTSAPFLVLEAGDAHLFAGICGRIWSPRTALAEISDPAEFRDWSVPGTVRVLFAHWSVAVNGGAALISEARVTPVDRSARRALRRLWPLIGRFEGLIATEPLRIAAQRADGLERRGQRRRPKGQPPGRDAGPGGG